MVIEDSGKSYSYEQLQERVAGVQEHFKPRALTFLLCRNSIGSLIGYLACIKGDVPILLLDANKSPDVIKQLIDIYRPSYIWMPDGDEAYEYGSVDTRSDGYVLVKTGHLPYYIHPDVALLLTTSGSTGSPKLVKITLANLRANAEQIADYLKINADERPITSLPMYYSYGLSVINSHLLRGADILMTDKGVLQREFWDFARREHATSIAGVPYTYEMLRRLRIFNMDLPDLRTMTQAGGKLNPKLVKEFVEKAECSGRRFVVMYGQTEATARMSYTPTEKALEKHASIGVAIPGGEFALLDANGREIQEPDVEGELIYRGPNVSMGYAECIADLAKGDENHGVLHTGDIAKRDSDGYYYITGRLKRFLKVWGNRCNLDSLESILRSVIPESACAGIDDKITVFVTENDLEQKVKTLLCETTGLNSRAFAVKVIPSIPRNPSGKILYSELQKLVEQ